MNHQNNNYQTYDIRNDNRQNEGNDNIYLNNNNSKNNSDIKLRKRKINQNIQNMQLLQNSQNLAFDNINNKSYPYNNDNTNMKTQYQNDYGNKYNMYRNLIESQNNKNNNINANTNINIKTNINSNNNIIEYNEKNNKKPYFFLLKK